MGIRVNSTKVGCGRMRPFVMRQKSKGATCDKMVIVDGKEIRVSNKYEYEYSSNARGQERNWEMRSELKKDTCREDE